MEKFENTFNLLIGSLRKEIDLLEKNCEFYRK